MIALVATFMMAAMLTIDNHYKNADKEQWNKTASEVLDSAIKTITLNEVTGSSMRGISSDTQTYWLSANLGADKILVNPLNSLCNLRIRPPKQESYISYDYSELNALVDATGAKTNHLEVKPVSSSWFDSDDRKMAIQKCKELNFDNNTVTYQGKAMYELLKIN